MAAVAAGEYVSLLCNSILGSLVVQRLYRRRIPVLVESPSTWSRLGSLPAPISFLLSRLSGVDGAPSKFTGSRLKPLHPCIVSEYRSACQLCTGSIRVDSPILVQDSRSSSLVALHSHPLPRAQFMQVVPNSKSLLSRLGCYLACREPVQPQDAKS